ncbi:uncharacterized protein LOC118439162 [Folsomia candida]|uniref:uncharacterized protein LOC118439162 n=1 Tax=Folsomia candida TaxID=158441 RepID=UPI001604C15E|nr:uncharacterized protein LOC118439162 [Folsomia candida]XP_035716142.1 uncharacterized protein LOC118439162 [Folsomia candida]
MYGDFEAILTDYNTSTTSIDKHEISGYNLAVTGPNKKLVHTSKYRGPNSIDKFIDEVNLQASFCIQRNKIHIAMKQLSLEEEYDFSMADSCHICEHDFDHQSIKVRDHDHNTGLFRGAAHRECNSSYIQKVKIPVLMHNFRNYDSHLLLSSATKFGSGNTFVIPQNSEKFIGIICDKFMFIDSFMHLPKSLDTLVTNLHAKPEGFDDKFGIMIQHFSKERAVKLSRKGVYPYSYFSSWDKFKETKFPDISEFYNTLTCEGISQEDYDFGKSVFETECTDLGSYHDIYLTTDVLLLACVFESYRDMAISNFKLDPCHYFSLPGFSWDAALLSTKVKLELQANS